VTVHGWGNTIGYVPSESHNLQKTTLTVLSEEECNQALVDIQLQPTNSIICAQSRNSSVCNGNSGGPMIPNTADSNVAGAASLIITGCPRNGYNYYTNVSYFADWIRSQAVDELPACRLIVI